jgi:predicted anti-sigma-YlaC factor YlaD
MNHSHDIPTSTCEAFEEAVNHFLDGELPFEEQGPLYRHLADCEPCRRYLDSLLVFRRIIREENLAVPPHVDEMFLERLAAHKEAVADAQDSKERRDRRRELLPVVGRALTLATVVGFIVGTVVMRNNDATTPSAVVVGEEELMNFPTAERPAREASAVYVFYPGLTIEAENWVEPASLEPL